LLAVVIVPHNSEKRCKTRTKTLHQSAISNWETGKDEPELTIAQVKALCRALGKSLEELPEDFGPPK